jgi:hypothetical protein
MRPSLPAAMLLLALSGACATTLKPTAEARRLARNPPATIEGRVTDPQGLPAAGVRIQGIPRGRDVIWSAPQPTDAEGRFRLSVDAPSDYAFLIFEGDVSVVTTSPLDPARVHVVVAPGETRRGVALTFLRREREELFRPAGPALQENASAAALSERGAWAASWSP